MSSNPNDKINALFNWCVTQTKGYENVEIRNFTTSWKNGLGFCAILHRYGPELIEFKNLNPGNIFENCELAFNVAEKSFGIPSLLNPKDMVIMKSPDRLCMITYLSQFYNTLATKTPKLIKHEAGLLSAIENLENENKVKEEKISIIEDGNENNPIVAEERSDNQTCAICSKIIYLLEKLTVADICYHRSCYRENQLTNLKIRNKTLERQPKPINDPLIESHTKDDRVTSISYGRSSRSRLSPPIAPKPIRPPSLDSNLSEKVLDNNHFKSLHRQSEDHSSQSASSVNFISVNASSTESLGQNSSVTHNKTNESDHTSPNKLYPSSLDNSSHSLNSSFNKKRPAPPPPSTLPPKPSLIKPSLPVKLSTYNDLEEPKYPEDLNPFAEKNEITSTKSIASKHDSFNPFAEYMTDDNQNINENVSIKPHKRPAPKLPVKVPRVLPSKSSEPNSYHDIPKDKNFNSLISCTNQQNADDVIKNDGRSSNKSNESSNQKTNIEQIDINLNSNILTSLESKEVAKEINIPSSAEQDNDLKEIQIKLVVEPTKLDSFSEEVSKDMNVFVPTQDTHTVDVKMYSSISLSTVLCNSPEDANTDLDIPLPIEIDSYSKEIKLDSNIVSPTSLETPPDEVKTNFNVLSPTKVEISSNKVETDIPVLPTVEDKSPSEEFKVDKISSSNTIEPVEISKEVNISTPITQSIESEASNNLKNDLVSFLNNKSINQSENITTEEIKSTSLPSDEVKLKPEKKPRKKIIESQYKSQDSLSHSITSKSSTQKPPAPARPPPPKREVRGDNSYEFIPFESLYSELKDINEKQSEIEANGRELQNILWEADQNGGKFDEMLQAWLDLVQKKNDLYQKEAELHEILKRQELENRHSDLEYELRLLMGKQESQKTATEKAREEELIAQILDTVNARAELIDKTEELQNIKSTNEVPKSKNTLKSFFSIKQRSSSVGKVHPNRTKTFKIGKKKKKLETFTLH